MKDRDLMLLLLVAGGAWYLYTRNHGLTLLGAPAHPMLLPGGERDQISTIMPSGSTSTAATNVFSAISHAIQTIAQSISGPGNAPARQSQSFAISGAQAAGGPASNYGVPNVGDPMPAYDPSLADADPYWSWDFSFESPISGTVPAMDWTLQGPTDYNYIPPPPAY